MLLAILGSKTPPERRISQERDKILHWLSRIDYLKKQRDILAKHHGKTGKWFLDHPDFRLWMDGGENTILWCRGIRMYTGQGFLLSTYTKVLNSWCRENSDDVRHTFCLSIGDCQLTSV